MEQLGPRSSRAARSRRIRVHNERVQYFVQQRVVPEARRVLIYLPDDTRPRLVLLGTGDDWDPNCGCPPYPEDLDVTEWFPENRAVSSLERFPGTQCHLGNGYDIISLRGSGVGRRAGHESHEWARANETLHRLFSIEWMGPLIAVKRARHHSGRAINITPAEVSLINAVVEGWLISEMRLSEDEQTASQRSISPTDVEAGSVDLRRTT